ncbi:hypothetical protein [Yoonia sp. SS1-5]|uniref:Uncharacterized protein n=1 Tax=Yoonia rhodophyticola TaxID=3137370 RepID=A0AAN0MAY6_9RHOB
MHPPFYHVDHKISPDIDHLGDTRPARRRSLPQVLRLSPVRTGWPPVRLPFDDPDGVGLPSGTTPDRPQLQLVPPPRRGMRDALGRFLIRMGQKLILQNGLG